MELGKIAAKSAKACVSLIKKETPKHGNVVANSDFPVYEAETKGLKITSVNKKTICLTNYVLSFVIFYIFD